MFLGFMDIFSSTLAGVVIFSLLGYMALKLQVDISAVVQSGTFLRFNAKSLRLGTPQATNSLLPANTNLLGNSIVNSYLLYIGGCEFESCTCHNKIAIGEESNGKPYQVYFPRENSEPCLCFLLRSKSSMQWILLQAVSIDLCLFRFRPWTCICHLP